MSKFKGFFASLFGKTPPSLPQPSQALDTPRYVADQLAEPINPPEPKKAFPLSLALDDDIGVTLLADGTLEGDLIKFQEAVGEHAFDFPATEWSPETTALMQQEYNQEAILLWLVLVAGRRTELLQGLLRTDEETTHSVLSLRERLDLLEEQRTADAKTVADMLAEIIVRLEKLEGREVYTSERIDEKFSEVNVAMGQTVNTLHARLDVLEAPKPPQRDEELANRVAALEAAKPAKGFFEEVASRLGNLEAKPAPKRRSSGT